MGYEDVAATGALPVQRCGRCGHVQFPLAGRTAAVGRCRRCREPDPDWVAADGTGTLVSVTVVHPRPGDSESSARVAGIVELVEGPWVHAAIDAAPDDLTVGMALRGGVETPAADAATRLPVPVFRPV